MVGRHLRERRPQKRLGVEFVDQAVPLAAFDPLVEGRQHPLRQHVQVSVLHAVRLPSPPPPTTDPLPWSLLHLTLQRHGLPARAGLGFTLGPQARQTVRPNRVRDPTDGSFASCCSPPRLTATQLHLATGRSRHTCRGLAPPDWLRLHAHDPGLRREDENGTPRLVRRRSSRLAVNLSECARPLSYPPLQVAGK